MCRFDHLLLLAIPFTSAALAANIFVSHYIGTVNSVTLTQRDTGNYSLTLNSSLYIGGQPSWLTWDSASRTLYIPDETSYGTAYIWSVAAATDGSFTQTGKATALQGGVANALYGNKQYIATAH
jgi:6-phosphogluconolactonase (cycloisomerase 2 family)